MNRLQTITLGQLTQFVALAISTSFVASFCYDWGFLSSLGLSFAQVPATPSDNVQSALNWLPWVTIIVGGNLLWFLLNEVADDGLDPHEILSSNNRLQRWGYRFRLGVAYLTLAFFVVMFVMYGEIAVAAGAIAASVIWFGAVLTLFRTPRLLSKYSYSSQLIFAVVPAVMLLLFGYGWAAGVGTTRQGYVSTIEYADGRTRSAVVLRTYERGLLLQDARDLRFERWDAISAVRLYERRPIYLGLACVWLGACRGDRVPTTSDPPPHARN